MAVIAAVETPAVQALPAEITEGEAEFQKRQQDLESNLHRFCLSTMNHSAEERRNLMAGWVEVHLGLLEEQAASSEALDTLYDIHGIPPEPDPLTLMEATRPRKRVEMASPSGRRWVLERQIAEIRQTDGNDPEKLRDSLHHWFEANGSALEEAEREERQERALKFPRKPMVAEQEKIAIMPPPEAGPALQRFFEWHNTLLDISDADPSPLRNGGDADFEEMDAWRERASQITEPVVEELEQLNQQLSAEGNLRIAKENKYETRK